MPESTRELIVFPTELSLRRYQQELALKQGWVDASGHTTFARLRKLCLPYTQLKKKPLSGAKELLMRKQVVEVARGHFVEGGPLKELSDAALADVLQKWVAELSSLPEETARIIDWMLSRSRTHKLYQLGILFSVWRAALQQEGLADPLDINSSILKLLQGNREKWPPLLREAKKLIFRSVRWFNPFEESCVIALNQKLKLRVESALPPAHAEEAEDRLGQQIHSEIMAAPWAIWAEDLGDALAVESPQLLQLADAERISFSRSAGAYGEIEDLARRMAWTLQTLNIPAHRMALVVPNVGPVQDIIPHVFGRFQIPYYFRRGRPVLSSPCVKAFFSWLAFPLRAERDAWIDLIRNPSIRFEDREKTIATLIKKHTPPRMDLKSIPYFQGLEYCSGQRAAQILTERMVDPEDHFNTEALSEVAVACEGFGEQQMPLRDLISLLEELLKEATIRPRDSHEQGVWILNPHDAVDLEFDVVLFAGLNEGEFPSVPQQDSLLSDNERRSLWKHLEEQGRRLPRLALPQASALFEQESVLFLTALGLAREQLVLSFQAVDQEGNEKSEGEYYRKLWNLAGGALNPYDRWRIEQLGEESIFYTHWKTQQTIDSEDRVAMPGESFLPIIPLPLCRAKDEALQAAVQQGRKDPVVLSVPPASSGLSEEGDATHLLEMLKIESERETFLETSVEDRAPSKYCGHIGGLKNKIIEWFEKKDAFSPTALEALAQCRYMFLLERMIGLRDPRTADDAPNPMDRGGLIHEILFKIYTALAEGTAGIDVPRIWAVQTGKGWMKRNEPGVDAIALVNFVPELENKYLEFAEAITRRLMAAAVAEGRMLGHPGVWAAEQEKVLAMVLNFIRYDVKTCAVENRFPALFELQFGTLRDVAGDVPLVELSQEDESIRVHGKIDRIDLIFAETGDLQKVRVLDYKGASRARNKTEDYGNEMRSNLDCQLPIYAFAAQEYFWKENNTPQVNALTEVGYLFYQREFKKIGSSLKKSLVSMDEPELIEGFLTTLFKNIQRLKAGDFAVDPRVEAYNDEQSICRTEAVTREDFE